MNITIQHVIVLTIVALAAIYLVYKMAKTFTGKKGNCGCDSGKAGCAKIAQMNKDMEMAGKGKKVSRHQ